MAQKLESDAQLSTDLLEEKLEIEIKDSPTGTHTEIVCGIHLTKENAIVATVIWLAILIIAIILTAFLSSQGTLKSAKPQSMTSPTGAVSTGKLHRKFEMLAPWEEGMFDLHHINTGAGNAAFYVFPDGTTFLIDAGEIGDGRRTEFIEEKSLRIGPRRPSKEWTSGAAIANYVKQVVPKTWNKQLDFALVTHFHSDHYGDVDETSKLAKSGKYLLSGLTEVDEEIPIRKLFDRDYPDYSFPLPLKEHYANDSIFPNYIKFIEAKGSSGNLEMDKLQVGSIDQIYQLNGAENYSSFAVRCLKKNGEIWRGSAGNETTPLKLFDAETFLSNWENNQFNENPLSIAMHFEYGSFTYFTGGDMTGLQGYGLPTWFDTETPTTRPIGQVDVTTLNHHGNRDGTNIDFVKHLQPQVVVQQAWCSDHPGMESFYRLISKDLYNSGRVPDLFSLYMHDNVKLTYGNWFVQAYKSFYGHVLVRVMPEGEEFYVYVLDDTQPELKVKETFGPYPSGKSHASDQNTYFNH